MVPFFIILFKGSVCMLTLNRMDGILNCVPKSCIVADIGTDHGYIPVKLIERDIANYVIASDISSYSIEKAQTLIERKNLTDRIYTRVGYGLSILRPREVEVAIIAGLGGTLIAEILEKDKEIASTISKFVLQPMQQQRALREYLLNSGYTIENEILVREDRNRYYVIMVVEHGQEDVMDDLDYYLGRRLVEKRDPLLPEYILYNIKKRCDILANLKKSRNANIVSDKQLKLEREIERLKEVYEHVCKG